MIDRHTVFEIHRMARDGDCPSKISKNLNITRKTVKKYLKTPNPARVNIKRESKLDPFKEEIVALLEKDSSLSSSVIYQRISKLGYRGKTTILKDYMLKVRPNHKNREAFIRFESPP
jgi:transposase